MKKIGFVALLALNLIAPSLCFANDEEDVHLLAPGEGNYDQSEGAGAGAAASAAMSAPAMAPRRSRASGRPKEKPRGTVGKVAAAVAVIIGTFTGNVVVNGIAQGPQDAVVQAAAPPVSLIPVPLDCQGTGRAAQCSYPPHPNATGCSYAKFEDTDIPSDLLWHSANGKCNCSTDVELDLCMCWVEQCKGSEKFIKAWEVANGWSIGARVSADVSPLVTAAAGAAAAGWVVGRN